MDLPSSADRIDWIRLSICYLPPATPISDAKVLTGRQKPMTEVALLFAEIRTADGHEGLGLSYSKRAGGPGQFAHAREIAPVLLGEDPSDYNTSGGFLHTPLEQLLVNAAASRERGVGGIKLKVGQPDRALDVRRVEAVRKHLGDDVPLMVDANQQWNRPTAQRMCRIFEQFDLVWIEEPLDAYDHEGHAALAAQFDTPIATGEMLTSAAEHAELVRHRGADYLQPDAPRVGGITPFLKIAAQAEHAGLMLAPHFAMELHVHLAAAYPTEPWVEHFDWLEPLFNERLQIEGGRMRVPNRPGLGITLSEHARGLDARPRGVRHATVARTVELCGRPRRIDADGTAHVGGTPGLRRSVSDGSSPKHSL